VLRGLEISERLIELGNPAIRMRMHPDRRVLDVPLFDIDAEDTAYPFLLFLSQSETERVLNEHLSAHGVGVERETELVEFRAGGEIVTCTVRRADGTTEEVRTRFLVGCDGAHSSVRRGAGIRFVGGGYPQTFALPLAPSACCASKNDPGSPNWNGPTKAMTPEW